MAKTRRNLREASRSAVSSDVDEGYRPNDDQIRTGAILRIADATEVMARDHFQMQADLNHWKDRADHHQRRSDTLARRNAGLRGYITRLKAQ